MQLFPDQQQSSACLHEVEGGENEDAQGGEDDADGGRVVLRPPSQHRRQEPPLRHACGTTTDSGTCECSVTNPTYSSEAALLSCDRHKARHLKRSPTGTASWRSCERLTEELEAVAAHLCLKLPDLAHRRGCHYPPGQPASAHLQQHCVGGPSATLHHTLFSYLIHARHT